MSGFNAGAIDPALLSGGPNDTFLGLVNETTNGSSATNNETTAGINPATLHQTPSQSFSTNLLASTAGTSNSSLGLAQSSVSHSSPSNAQFSNLHNHNHLLNQPSSSSTSLQSIPQNRTVPSAPPGTHSAFSNGAPPAHATPSNSESSAINGLPAKEHEMHQKDQELAQFLLKMEEYKPIMPDEVAKYYLQKVGFECNDIKVQRLLVLACQKFVSDIAQDAFSYARTRTGQAPGGRQGPLAPNSNSAGLSNGLPNNPGARKDRTRTVLTQEDLAQALAEYGINASRAPYYL